jgi:hypothetical protein
LNLIIHICYCCSLILIFFTFNIFCHTINLQWQYWHYATKHMHFIFMVSCIVTLH